MVLSDVDIKKLLLSGDLVVDPLPDLESRLGPCSIDLRLGNTFKVFEHSRVPYIDVRQKFDPDHIMRTFEIADGDSLVMQPGELILAVTVERLEIPDYLLGRLEGRSSLGRLGIIVHGTAPRFDPGWVGNAVMELGNIGRIPICLSPGMPICSMTFEQITSPAERPYRLRPGSKYVNQDGPHGSRLSQETGE
ncbi:MAG TPA: dCTP deaminase [Armatimonadota bacterium]|jgi:dCTP deaminase